MIVVDTNIVAYLLIEGGNTPRAQELWRKDPHWRLPVLWRHEFLNVLATYARSGGMTGSDAKQVWRAANSLFSAMQEEVDMPMALQHSVEKGISAYDAQFVVLAHSLGVPLVSEDKRLREKCGGIVVTLAESIGA